jgi:protein TonB
LFGGLLITVAVFLFMQSLIESRQQQDVLLPVFSKVEILRQEEPKEEEPEPEEAEPEEPVEEPLMDSLQVASPTPEPALNLEISALDLALGDIKIQSVGDRWKGPVGTGVGAVNLAGGGGEDAQGFIEVIPYDTRRPNVPEVAYQNRVSGWVLVAFKVSGDGTTRDVQVLNAQPRGVFEEKVVAAVSDWKYRVAFYGGATGDVVLTQKVDVSWENYPQNLPNVD